MSDHSEENMEKWEKFRYFLGGWRGTGTGKPGESQAERSYRLILSDQFIEIKHRSTFAPQEANPDGEIHEEIGYLSFDKHRSLFVMREFHVEGFVNQYVLEDDGREDSFTFISEALENLSSEWRARTTVEILGEDNFRETFELARPGEGWSCYITNEFQRA